MQQQDFAGDRLNIRHDVGGEDHDLILADAGDEVAQHNPLARVKPGGRFVQDQDGRVVEQRLGQQQPLLHAAGIAAHPRPALVGQLDAFKRAARGLGRRLAGHAFEGGDIFEVFLPGEKIVQRRLLRRYAEHGAVSGPQRKQIPPAVERPAFGRPQRAAQNVHQGAFARAVRPEQPIDARGKGVAEIDQRPGFAIPLAQMLRRERGGSIVSQVLHGGPLYSDSSPISMSAGFPPK